MYTKVRSVFHQHVTLNSFNVHTLSPVSPHLSPFDVIIKDTQNNWILQQQQQKYI